MPFCKRLSGITDKTPKFEGKTIGGHLDDGCIIYTNAEIFIGIVKTLPLLEQLVVR